MVATTALLHSKTNNPGIDFLKAKCQCLQCQYLEVKCQIPNVSISNLQFYKINWYLDPKIFSICRKIGIYNIQKWHLKHQIEGVNNAKIWHC